MIISNWVLAVLISITLVVLVYFIITGVTISEHRPIVLESKIVHFSRYFLIILSVATLLAGIAFLIFLFQSLLNQQ